jgi:hypothetical protein
MQRPDSTLLRSGFAAALTTPACWWPAAACSRLRSPNPGDRRGRSAELAVRDSTLATLIRSVNGRNTTNYGLCFADTLVEHRDFHASFDPFGHYGLHAVRRSRPGLEPRSRGSFSPVRRLFAERTLRRLLLRDPDRDDVDLGGPTQIHISNLLYRAWSAGTPVAVGSVGMTFERWGSVAT